MEFSHIKEMYEFKDNYKLSSLNKDNLNEIRQTRRSAVHKLKTKISIVPKNELHNLTYQRRNGIILPFQHFP